VLPLSHPHQHTFARKRNETERKGTPCSYELLSDKEDARYAGSKEKSEGRRSSRGRVVPTPEMRARIWYGQERCLSMRRLVILVYVFNVNARKSEEMNNISNK
jgi:hypothetical protein